LTWIILGFLYHLDEELNGYPSEGGESMGVGHAHLLAREQITHAFTINAHKSNVKVNVGTRFDATIGDNPYALQKSFYVRRPGRSL